MSPEKTSAEARAATIAGAASLPTVTGGSTATVLPAIGRAAIGVRANSPARRGSVQPATTRTNDARSTPRWRICRSSVEAHRGEAAANFAVREFPAIRPVSQQLVRFPDDGRGAEVDDTQDAGRMRDGIPPRHRDGGVPPHDHPRRRHDDENVPEEHVRDWLAAFLADDHVAMAEPVPERS